jgi:hypothetical protein
VSRSAAFFASLLVTLGRPAWWLLALAGFLARGGIVVVILPIVSFPSPLALSNLVAPVVVPLALGRVEPVVVAAIGLLVAGVVTWLVAGGIVGAATDVALIRDAAAAASEEGVTGPAGSDGRPDQPHTAAGRRLIPRILAVRLLCHVPFAVTLAIASIGIATITYSELTRPDEVATPLVVRVLVAAARPIGALGVAWFLGEVAGGVAARRIVLDGDSVRRAIGRAISDLVRRPRSTLLPALATTIPLLVILGGTLGGARVAWLRADNALANQAQDPLNASVSLVVFVAIWLAALAMIGVLAAARSAALTFAAVRKADRQAAGGTFGASAHHRPGDWPVDRDGGSL